MANLDISSKLGHEKQEITIAEGKTYEVDCSAETMLKAQDIFKKDDSLEGLFTAIKLLLGAKAEKDIRAMKLTVNGLKTVIIAIMAQVNEISYEEMEKRFQNK
ncbi:MAG TPA: hypothetical protein OIM42_05000 [Clostridiaceae bacterium]|jgi:hypothetical protein|nr:MAG TPA: hypothetical protein [Caudoviricetes sp.]HJJ14198.1 hypothetical protein [Clostridiaceae bacterium]